MNHDSSSRIADDEIDIRSIIRKIYSFLIYPFQLIFSNKIVILVFIVAAIFLAVVLKRSLPKTYSSSFIVKPLDAKEKVHFKMLYDIQTLLKYKDYSAITTELKIDTGVSQKIVALQTLHSSSKNPADSSNIAEIVITTTDYTQFIPIQNALLNYLENNPYFNKIKNLQESQIEVELEQVEKDLVQLDSLKAIQLRTFGKQTISGQNSVLFDEFIDPTTLYTAQTDRILKKSNLMARRKFLDNFQLIKPCITIRQATSPPRLLVFCFYLIPVFLVICIVFLHFKTQKINRRALPQQGTN